MSQRSAIVAASPRISIQLLAVLAAVVLAASNATPASAATRVNGTALSLLAGLRILPEHPGGYARELFVLWGDADGDGCNTRDEVLIAESRIRARVLPGCVVEGSWRSAYDGVITRDPSTLDVDHVVPLREAWDSGAWTWTPARRQSYANDLGDWRSLRAVSASSNRSKGDRDPAEWLPPLASARCTYATDWVVIKVRWRLGVDAREHAALVRQLRTCPVHNLTVALP